jgi:hypothetical protein
LRWFSAICTFMPDIAAIETARAEKITTNIMDMIRTAPRFFERVKLLVSAIFRPPLIGKTPLNKVFL